MLFPPPGARGCRRGPKRWWRLRCVRHGGSKILQMRTTRAPCLLPRSQRADVGRCCMESIYAAVQGACEG